MSHAQSLLFPNLTFLAHSTSHSNPDIPIVPFTRDARPGLSRAAESNSLTMTTLQQNGCLCGRFGDGRTVERGCSLFVEEMPTHGREAHRSSCADQHSVDQNLSVSLLCGRSPLHRSSVSTMRCRGLMVRHLTWLFGSG